MTTAQLVALLEQERAASTPPPTETPSPEVVLVDALEMAGMRFG